MRHLRIDIPAGLMAPIRCAFPMAQQIRKDGVEIVAKELGGLAPLLRTCAGVSMKEKDLLLARIARPNMMGTMRVCERRWLIPLAQQAFRTATFKFPGHVAREQERSTNQQHSRMTHVQRYLRLKGGVV